MASRLAVIISCLLALSLPANAQAPAAAAPPPMREISDAIFEIGSVRLDKEKRTVTFLASVNMTEGDAEYAIVGSGGKTHESVLRTSVSPFHIHLAMLLLGSKTAAAKKPSAAGETEKPPAAIDAEYLARAPKLTGDPVGIEVSYEREGKAMRHPLEDFLWNSAAEKPMSRGLWLYNGSLFYERQFCAQIDESIAAVITDPCALINNPRGGGESDASWTLRPNHLPAEGTPVTITLNVAPASEEPSIPHTP